MSSRDDDQIHILLDDLGRLPLEPSGDHLSDAEFIGYATGELEPRDVGRVERHLASCSDCASEMTRLVAPLDREKFVPVQLLESTKASLKWALPRWHGSSATHDGVVGSLGHLIQSFGFFWPGWRQLALPGIALLSMAALLTLLLSKRDATLAADGPGVAERAARRAVSLNNLALLAKETGEPWRAVFLYEEALGEWRALRHRAGEATTLHNIGTLYTALGRLPDARGVLERALQLRHGAGRRRDEAATVMALGWVRCREGDFALCRRDLLRSLAMHREVGDRQGEAAALDRLGSAWRETGRPARAVAEYEKALAILRESGDRRSEAVTLSNLGEALTAAGDPAAGLHHLDAALRLFDALGDPSPAEYAYLRRATAKRALGNLHAARADIEEGLERLELYRARAESGPLRTSYLTSVHEEFEFAVDLLMELHRKEPRTGHDRAALDIAERARTRGLLDLLAEARVNAAATAALAGNRELSRVEAEIRAGDRQTDGVGEARLRRLFFERELLLAELRQAGAAEARPATVLNTTAIQRRVLDRDTLLLVYALGERRSFVWAVTPEDVESAVLPPRADLTAVVERLHRVYARPLRLGAATEARLVSAEVSNLLLGGVAHRLGNKRLAIAADGVLARVPFAALPDPRGGGEPLVERHEVVTLPSASVLAAIRQRVAARPPAPRLLAVVADPVLERGGEGAPATAASSAAAMEVAASVATVTRAARDLGLADLRPLPFARQEAAAVAALAPPAQTLRATGTAARRELIMDGGLAHYRIVHLATHALLNPRHPELSGVVLSLFDDSGRPQNGFLRSYEIVDLDLPTDLVVLSACRTGVGKEVRGEGLVGLTQSFLQAGAARVVASLWDVDDAATARLMTGFYRELLVTGRSPAAALRAAQRAMRAEPRWSAPFSWAGFVVAGEWRSTQGDCTP